MKYSYEKYYMEEEKEDMSARGKERNMERGGAATESAVCEAHTGVPFMAVGRVGAR